MLIFIMTKGATEAVRSDRIRFYLISSLRSMERGILFVPFARTSTRQTRAFSVVGPSMWIGHPLAQLMLILTLA